MRLKDKVAVFIGGASEIASASGKMFLKEGASIVLVDYSRETLEQVMPHYAGNENRVRTVAGDVTSYEQMLAAVEYAVREFGRVDILVNFAGIIINKPIDVLTVEEWQKVMDINITGVFNACKAVVPLMKERGYGRIVNISSLGGRTGRPGVGVNYAASKAGVVGLSQTLARELAPWGITVNVLAPGPLKGRMFYSMEPEVVAVLEKTIPLGRVGEMDEIAYAVVYLASDEASWTTGEVLDVNGGAYM